jgi:hypothetical protein
MKKAFLFFSIFVFTFSSTTLAQRKATKRTSNSSSSGSDYKTGLGVKFLDGAGITLKHFVNEKAALEGIGFFWSRGGRVTCLYELHFDIDGAPGLKWYIGPGVHVGFYGNRYGGGSFAGVDGVLGLDYKIKNAPLNLSIDWQPSFEFGLNRGFTGSWGGFGIRYTF